MANSTLLPLTRAVDARRKGQEPSLHDLDICRKMQWKVDGKPSNDITCFNGNIYDGSCGYFGSRNIPIAAATGLANWDFIISVCQQESAQGDGGVEHRSTSHFYHGLIFNCFVTTYHALVKLNRHADAEIVRKSILSKLAWDSLCAFPVSRRQDSLFLPDRVIKSQTKKIDASICVAVSGMRNTIIQRGQFTSQNSHSVVLANALRYPYTVGITGIERDLLQRTINGDVNAAHTCSAWMMGVIDSPSNRIWQFHITRTSNGVQVDMSGLQAPNPMKPAIAACVLTSDGHWRTIQTSHRVLNWAEGFRVWRESSSGDGAIHAGSGIVCAESLIGKGKSAKLQHVSMADIESYGGKVLWKVDVVGRKVTFSEI